MTKDEFWNALIDRITICEQEICKGAIVKKAATYDLICEDLQKVEIEKESEDD